MAKFEKRVSEITLDPDNLKVVGPGKKFGSLMALNWAVWIQGTGVLGSNACKIWHKNLLWYFGNIKRLQKDLLPFPTVVSLKTNDQTNWRKENDEEIRDLFFLKLIFWSTEKGFTGQAIFRQKKKDSINWFTWIDGTRKDLLEKL